jgi:hypothetical protein
MIQLTRSGLILTGHGEEVASLRGDLDRQHCVRMRQFLAPDLLRLIQSQLDGAEFQERIYHDSGTPPPVTLSLPQDTAVFGFLRFLVNNGQFFEVVRQIAGLGPIGSVEGDVYRMVPGLGHFDSWHDDLGGGRMLAMAINLSTETFRGGLLQIRELESGRMVYEVANTGFGDAAIFRISRHLEHRVTPVEGTAARTVFAGWFLPKPDYRSWYQKERAAPILGECAAPATAQGDRRPGKGGA